LYSDAIIVPGILEMLLFFLVCSAISYMLHMCNTDYTQSCYSWLINQENSQLQWQSWKTSKE